MEEFLGWCEKQGFEFPCTAWQFTARVAAFLRGRWNAEEFAALMEQGIGQDWRDMP